MIVNCFFYDCKLKKVSKQSVGNTDSSNMSFSYLGLRFHEMDQYLS